MQKLLTKLFGILAMVTLLFGSFAALPLNAKAANSSVPPLTINPRFYSPDPSNVYTDGQKIRIDINYNKIGLKVTADLSKIDSRFSSTYPVRDNKTGTYTLITPEISGETVNFSSAIEIPFVAKDSSGRTFASVSSYKVTLKPKQIKAGAKIVAPVRLSAQGKDKTVTIWWSRIYNAKYILIKFTDQEKNQRLVVAPKSSTGKTITNLENGIAYDFYVAGVSSNGSVGEFKKITASPVGPKVEKKPTEAKVKAETPKAIDKSAANQTKVEQNQNTNTVNQTKNDKKPFINFSKIKFDWVRFFLALAILLVATGITIGGYYAYESYLNRKTTKKSSKKEPQNRW